VRDTQIVVELLKHNEVDVNLSKIIEGMTALSVASQRGSKEIVVELLKTRRGGCESPR
jgi:ankyrin repeat protein